MTRHFILATAGHVDHGKSSLVRALTGTDPDRLPEEKARGITIDLGFAHLDLPAADDSAVICRLGIVDVPGHEDFVKNMVAGVGSVDIALFVVAADDGWMPQTEEHLQILAYLGVTRAVVALTKADLVEGGEASAIAALRGHLRDSPFPDAPIVPNSAIMLRGLDEIKAALSDVLAKTPSPRDIGKPRLSVDRAFSRRGIGTIVTGTLAGGALSAGQSVVIQPGAKATRVRGLQSHNQDVTTTVPGTRTALNLTGLAVTGSRSSNAVHEGVQRGDVVTLSDLGNASDTVDVLLLRSSRLRGAKLPAARPIKDGTRVRIHHGSGDFPARLSLLDRKELGAGESAIAELRLEAPLFALVDDRFIVRDWSEQTTLAGGIVLDAEAIRRVFRRPAHREFLATRARALSQADAYVFSQIKRDHAVRRCSLLVRSNFTAAEVEQAVKQLADAGTVQIISDVVAESAYWRKLHAICAAAIDTQHKSHPEHAGLLLSQLRAELRPSLPAIDVFDTLREDLFRNGFADAGAAIRRAEHRPSLPPELQATGARLRQMLESNPFEPPSRKELAPDELSQKALRFLRETGEVVELGPGVILATTIFTRMREMVAEFIRARGLATASELRQHLGTTRRIVIPLLERLDHDGFTLRQGELRSLRTPKK